VRAAILLAACAALAACGAASTPCDGQPAQCLNVTVESRVPAIDQLSFRVDKPKREIDVYPDVVGGPPLAFPLQLALLFPAGTNDINIVLLGFDHGGQVGFAAQQVNFPPSGIGKLTFVVEPLASGDAGAPDL
jgi:hypothetical protein